MIGDNQLHERGGHREDDDQRGAGEEADAVEPGSGAIDADVAQAHDVVGTSVHDHAVGAGIEHAAPDAAAVDGDRLGDGDPAEAARVEHGDRAAGRGLDDRAGEGLARRGAAARIDVVADARDPGAGRLGAGRRPGGSRGSRGASRLGPS